MKLPFKTQPPEDLSTQIKLLSAALDEADCIMPEPEQASPPPRAFPLFR